MTRTRTDELGPAARPVAVPEELDDAFVAKVTELIAEVSWRGVIAPSNPNDSNWRAIKYADFSIEQHWNTGGMGGGSVKRISTSTSFVNGKKVVTKK